LVFTVEAGAGDGFQLLPVRRYAHSPKYISRVAHAAGMVVRELTDATLRTEATVPVAGLVVTLTIGEPGAA
jgi:predicted TPR repeat methyltransferase